MVHGDGILASWSDGPAKKALAGFVGKIDKKGSSGLVPPAVRYRRGRPKARSATVTAERTVQ
jgi:hypothetical protein